MKQLSVSEFRLKLYPKDFAAVRTFYEITLGFEVLDEWDRGETDKGVMFRVGPAVLEVLSPANDYRQITGSDLSLEVPDVNTLWEELKDIVTVIFELRDNDWGDTSFCVADPEGFKVTFFTKQKDMDDESRA